jgi:hypothetical protein
LWNGSIIEGKKHREEILAFMQKSNEGGSIYSHELIKIHLTGWVRWSMHVISAMREAQIEGL